MDKDFSRDYDPKEYKEDRRFIIAFKEAKRAQLFYFIPTVLTIILIYTLSPELGEPAQLLFGYPVWYTVSGILWLVVFAGMLLYLKFGVKTVSFSAHDDEREEE